MVSDLTKMIEQVSREKGVEPEVLVEALEEAVKAAARKKLGQDYDLEVNYNKELGEIEVFEFKEVVKEITDIHTQLSLKEGLELDPEAEEGDSLGIKMDPDTFGRIAAQSAKQVIMQRLKEAERDIVYDDFKDRRGEIVNGIVQRFDRGAIVVNLGRTEADLPFKEQVPKESYKQGDRIRSYILDVRQFSRGSQIVLSRTHPNFVSGLFENEVPEIAEGIVEIVQVAREPGLRSKIAVVSRDPDVDPVGACVGMKGSRVQAVVQELRGEKIDIVTWDSDDARFICNALSPAEIIRVIVDEDNHSMEVVVPDDQLSLAIGKRGQNVRLASRLTGWRLDVTGEASYNQNLKDGHRSLLELQGVGEKMASDLYEAGLTSASDVAGATVEELLAVEGIGEKTALVLIEEATILIQEQPPGMSSAEDTETEEDTGTEEDTEIVEPTVLEPSEAGIEEETRADKMQNEDVLSNNKEGSGENAGNEES